VTEGKLANAFVNTPIGSIQKCAWSIDIVNGRPRVVNEAMIVAPAFPAFSLGLSRQKTAWRLPEATVSTRSRQRLRHK
jgi:hypothetical protein